MLDIASYTLSHNHSTIVHARHNVGYDSLLDLVFFLAFF
jgi:hypothetical protein